MFRTVPGTLLTELDNIKTESLAMGRVRILVYWLALLVLSEVITYKGSPDPLPYSPGIPGSSSSSAAKNSPAVRGSRFDPWAGNIPWRRKWQLIPLFLPGKSHGQRSLVSYSSWGCKRVGHNWTHTHTNTHICTWYREWIWSHICSDTERQFAGKLYQKGIRGTRSHNRATNESSLCSEVIYYFVN